MRKAILITGASSGIGKATALALGRLEAVDLILVARSERRLQRVAGRISHANPANSVACYACDLASLASVEKLSREILEKHPVIDVLINNAGGRFDTYQQSEDEVELTFATNHLGGFTLTQRLLEPLLRASEPRILNVSSSAHFHARAPVEWNGVASRFDRKQAYASAKLANILHIRSLQEQFNETGMVCCAIDPGPTATRFARNNGHVAWIKHWAAHRMKGDLRTASEGADTIVYLATTPLGSEAKGQLFRDRRVIAASPLADDSELAAQLWKLSECLTKGIDRTGALSH